MVGYRRGKARSLGELNDQVARIDELRASRVRQRRKKKQAEFEIKEIETELDRIKGNVGRYYFSWLALIPAKAAKTIKLASGVVGSRAGKSCEFESDDQDEIVRKIIDSGRWEQFLQKPELKLSALKDDPEFAASVGIRVTEVRNVTIGTKHK